MTKAFVKFEGPYQTFVNNKVVTEGVPYTVIGLLLVNMSFNVFCWVWEIKSDRLLEKTKIIWRMMFPKTSVSDINLKNHKTTIYSLTIEDMN